MHAWVVSNYLLGKPETAMNTFTHIVIRLLIKRYTPVTYAQYKNITSVTIQTGL